MADITIGEYLDAMEKNGYPQAFNRMIELSYSQAFNRMIELTSANITAACAMGQAQLNLGFLTPTGTPTSIRQRYLLVYTETTVSFKETIVHLNDNERMSVPQIAKFMREMYSEHLNDIMYGEILDAN